MNYVIETGQPQWATETKALLLGIKAAVDKACEAGRKRLALRQKQEFLAKYDEVIEQAKQLYGTLQRKKGRRKRRTAAESPLRAAARKLACRLDEKRDQILLFMKNFRVPFDNNQSERDLRMLKVKQQISGCFRTDKGAKEFCRVRGYLATMKKQGASVMAAVRSVCAGETMMPAV